MSIDISVKWDRSQLVVPDAAALKRTLKKAGATALRDMKSEASKRIRARKRIKVSYINRAIGLSKPKGGDISDMSWAVNVSGAPVPLIAYPHRQTKKGVVVEVNRGKRTLVKGSFVSTMQSGHEGIFRRKGKARLPIQELFGSRPIDALLHKGEAQGVADRGGKSFSDTFQRVLPLEIAKK